MKLHEIANNDQEIIDWFSRYTDAQSVEVKNGEATLHSQTTFVFLNEHVQEIPYPIHKVIYNPANDSSFVLRGNSELKSLKNLPKKSYEIDISGAKNITSLSGLALEECERLSLSFTPITDINEIFNHIPIDLKWLFFGHPNLKSLVGLKCDKKIDSIQIEHAYITEGGLGLLLIPGVELIMIDAGSVNPRCLQPLEIIASYAGRPEDIFECQAELIENGYEEYAQL